MNGKFEPNKTKDEKLKIRCLKCQTETNHIVEQSVDYRQIYDDAVFWRKFKENFQIIKCLGCDSLSFRHIICDSDDRYQIAGDEWEDGAAIILYPKRSASTRPTQHFYQAPSKVRRIYKETIDSFNNDCLTLCAAGLRAIIEGICAERGIENGPVEIKQGDGSIRPVRKNNLEGRINGLCEHGVLTNKDAEVLHEHRFLGNHAVHELESPSTEALSIAIDIIEHTMTSLYEIEGKAAKLRSIRKKVD